MQAIGSAVSAIGIVLALVAYLYQRRRDSEQDAMTLQCEATADSADMADAISATIADITKLKANVEIVPPGSLANDGKVIDDTRPIE